MGTPAPPEGARWPLSSLDLDDLVEELRGRASSARESQERLSSLLDAVLAVSSNLDLGEVPLESQAPGVYAGEVDLPSPGTWQVRVSLRVTELDDAGRTFTFVVGGG